TVLPESFARGAQRIATYAYVREGTDLFLKDFGPAQYHSTTEYEKVMGAPIGACEIGTEATYTDIGDVKINQRLLESDRDAETNYLGPRRKTLAAYLET